MRRYFSFSWQNKMDSSFLYRQLFSLRILKLHICTKITPTNSSTIRPINLFEKSNNLMSLKRKSGYGIFKCLVKYTLTPFCCRFSFKISRNCSFPRRPSSNRDVRFFKKANNSFLNISIVTNSST